MVMKRREFIKGSAIVGATLAGSKLVAESGIQSLSSSRKVHRIIQADRTKVGTLPILRAFAGDHTDYVSPYVLLDEFGPVALDKGADPLRVDAHPHAGVSPTTYFLKGTGHHKDSLDYDFEIGQGDFMMFNSGKGAIHMEESGQQLYEEGGEYHGFQIWLNMPAEYKLIDPTTTVNRTDDFGLLESDQYKVKIMLGELLGQKSSVKTFADAFYYHVILKENGKITIPTNPQHNAMVYSITGDTELNEQKKLDRNQIALFERGNSDILLYSKCGAELLVLGGLPLDERVYSYGPFVMNNEEQIRQCIQNYNSGKMGNPDLVNL